MIATVVGARPNFVRAAPIHRAFDRAGIPHAIVHTGQHYDEAMSASFFADLGLPRPMIDLGVGSGSHAEQVAGVMIGLERFLSETRPAALLVLGDVNSTMAAALVAAQMGLYCAHVEAGLRSGDWSMPEEVNRVVTDAVCDLLLTPSADADRNLLAEGCVPESIVRVGNVMIDTLLEQLPEARALDVPARFGLSPGKYAVLTLHRPASVDSPVKLAAIARAVRRIARRVPVIFPVHPRTRGRLHTAGGGLFAPGDGLRLCEPLGYRDFLSLTSQARLVLTDSGGLQEESAVLGIPCLTLRENTERPITVTEGTNVLVGLDEERILEAAERALSWSGGGGGSPRAPELWDGKAAGRIVTAIRMRLPNLS